MLGLCYRTKKQTNEGVTMGTFIRKQKNIFLTLWIASALVFSSQMAKALSAEEVNKINAALENHELDGKKVEEVASQLEANEKKNPKDDSIKAQLARVYYFIALDDGNKEARIKKYQRAIDKAEEALALNAENIVAHFWIAAAIGKQGLDIGISKSLKNARPMKEHLDKVLAKEEAYEKGSAHRAMGRLYFKLPGWPISFGSKEKSREHLEKAVSMNPQHLGNRAFLAETLKKLGNKEEAKKHVDFILAAPVDPKKKKENAEFIEIAQELKKDL